MHPPMSFWFGPPPQTSPPLETQFFEVLRSGGGVRGGMGWGSKHDPPFCGSKIMNILVFFYFELKKCYRVRTPCCLYGAEWDEC